MNKFGGDTGTDADHICVCNGVCGEREEITSVFILSWLNDDDSEEVTESYSTLEHAINSAKFYMREEIEEEGHCDGCEFEERGDCNHGVCEVAKEKVKVLMNETAKSYETLRAIVRYEGLGVVKK